MDKPNWEEFGNVGQDGTSKTVTEEYEKRYGTYKEQPVKVPNKPSPATIPTPFKLGQ